MRYLDGCGFLASTHPDHAWSAFNRGFSAAGEYVYLIFLVVMVVGSLCERVCKDCCCRSQRSSMI